MSTLGMVHVGFGIAALIMGGLVWFLPKGIGWHKTLGWAYVISMLGLNGSAFGIYKFTGHFGPFHALALISLFMTLTAVAPARWKRPSNGRWVVNHFMGMGWSYIGLWAATATEATIRLPFIHSRTGAIGGTIGATLLVMLIGGTLLTTYAVRMKRQAQILPAENALPTQAA